MPPGAKVRVSLSAPLRVRLPPHTLRMTTAGRMACSARQLVASIDGSRRKRNAAGNSLARCLAKRLASFSGGGASISRPSRASSRPRSESRPCRVSSPSWQRFRTSRPAWRLRPVLGEGRGLPSARAAGGGELLLEVFATTLPPVPVPGGARQVTVGARQVVDQFGVLPLELLNALVPRILLSPGRLRTAASAALASHAPRGIVPFVVELREWRTPCFRTEVVYFTPRQQPHRRAGPARPRRRPGSAGRGSPAPAGSAAPPPPARSPPSVESSGRRATA